MQSDVPTYKTTWHTTSVPLLLSPFFFFALIELNNLLQSPCLASLSTIRLQQCCWFGAKNDHVDGFEGPLRLIHQPA